jgi:hypothetical protein
MGQITVSKYDPSDQEIWDKFVQNSINGTIFHEQKFISYHGDKFDDCSLIFYKNNEIIALFPAAIINKINKMVLKSHPGTSYGGFVINKSLQLKNIFELIDILEKYCKNKNIEIIEFRHSPNIFRECPLDQIDFALSSNNYKRIDEELSTCYKLDIYKGKSENECVNLFQNYGRSKARKNIRKAIRAGLIFRELKENEYKIYYEILVENLKKHNSKPVHSLEEIKLLKRLYPKRINLYGVFKDENLAAGYLIFNINKIGNHIFYGSINYKYQMHRPTSFGLFKLIQTLSDQGHEYLNMGISTEDGGKIINWDLFDFKESFNGTGILRYYWQKKL